MCKFYLYLGEAIIKEDVNEVTVALRYRIYCTYSTGTLADSDPRVHEGF